jgi:hypothetical protein
VLRSILAVLAGIVTLTLVSFGIEWIVPKNETFMWAYGMLSVVLGGWVTARLAPSAPLKHAIAMGAVQVVLTFLSMLAPDHKVSLQQCVVIALFSFIAAIGGGLLFTAKRGSLL